MDGRGKRLKQGTSLTFAFTLLILAGCASPGPPKPPSLQLPGPVKSLAAERIGDVVTLHFTMPVRTTDDLPIRETSLTPAFCRVEPPSTACTPVPSSLAAIPIVQAHSQPAQATLQDRLPTLLTNGPLRPLGYRLELLNSKGRTAGFSEPVWTAAGRSPTPVAGLTLQPTRLGTLISWQPAPGDAARVIIRRTLLSAPAPSLPTPGKQPATVSLLRADDTAAQSDTTHMLDTTAIEGAPYTYSAWRERQLTLAGHTINLHSDETAPAAFTLRDVFPPPVPTDLTAAAFTSQPTPKQPAAFAVDLIWQPVDDPGLAGYNIYREAPGTPRIKLNATPVSLPAFHDTTANPAVDIRYSVTSVDRKGNESAAVTTALPAQAR